MNHVQQQALDRYNEARKNRVTLEIAQCEAVVAGHVVSAELRQAAGLALLHEHVARQWMQQLGVTQ
ncbi:hypothetical protein CFH99_07955 [Nocardioides aromaticivorans]|uniref:Antitoxin VbhA domain-containing protein n=1 Tax=Nocardioides aromaticivorans TaxID=200618 RepID=A0ABX7PIQ6_9ACTN|nr:hypothetical protein [Nocardioides aromaticivorans]QSR25555.1 hypothetical protein CFH99_07955 [Nocardioides aromaticivorans]